MLNWDSIRNEWATSSISFKDLAEKHGVKDSTIRSRKNREQWQRNATLNDATQRKNVATKRGGAPKGNQNAKGNKGGAAPKGNSNAVTHGLFQKYLPAESLEIMEQLKQQSPIDMLWDNIMIQYTAIIRAQQIMYVKDRDDSTTTKIGESSGDTSRSEKWEVQQAWDKQATFLQAQSRAMAELRSLVKQFNEMAHEDDERRLRLEQMELSVAKSKLELERLRADNEPDDDEDDGFIEALSGQAEEVWSDGDDSPED